MDEGRTRNVSGRPQIGSEHGISVLEAIESSHRVIFSGSGLTHTVGVDILDTGVLQDLLGNLGSDATGTSRGGDHAHRNRAHLALDLGRDGVDTTDSGAPITSTDGDEVHLGIDEGALDGNLDFLADLNTETDVTLSVTASDDSLESGSLTGLSLLLDRQDAHDLIRELGISVIDQSFDDLVFLDGNGVSINLLKRLDMTIFDKTAKLGKRGPLFFAASEATTAGSTSTAAATSTTAPSTGSETSASGGSISWCSAHSF